MKVSDPGIAQQAIPSSNVAPSKHDDGTREPGKVPDLPRLPSSFPTSTVSEPEHPPTERPPALDSPDVLTEFLQQLEPLAAAFRKASSPSYADRLERMTHFVLRAPHQYDLSSAVEIAARLLESIEAQAKHHARYETA